MRHRLAATILAAVTLLGCGEYSTSPYSDPGPEPDATITARVTDPAGDTFGSKAVQWDITALAITLDSTAITLVIDFARDVIVPFDGDSTAIIGVVDLDIDQNPVTGMRSIVDAFRPDSGATDIGADYLLVLAPFTRTDSTFEVLDSTRTTVGSVKPTIAGRRITARIPLSMLGNDDGQVNAAAVVGIAGSPTDIVPNDGHLTLGDPAAINSARRAPRSPALSGSPGLAAPGDAGD